VEAPPEYSELQSNGGTISAILTDTNGIVSPWTADHVRISRSQGRVKLYTNNYETGQTLLIEIDGEDQGAYIRDFGEEQSPVGYLELHREFINDTYYSNGANPGTFTEFTISFDTLNKTANGTFELSFGDDDGQSMYKLSKGQFNNVPYGYNRNSVEGTVYAVINGVPTNFSSASGYRSGTFNSLSFSFASSAEFSPFVRISLPSDISEGTYSAAENNLTDISALCARHISGPPAPQYIPDSLEINIIYHNLQTRAISGTYSFNDIDQFLFGDTLFVRDGTFEFVYNDWH
jgi:hypothetical protein